MRRAEGCLREGSGWCGTSLSLKPLSAEAKRKRAKGEGGAVAWALKKIKGSGWDTKQMCERI